MVAFPSSPTTNQEYTEGNATYIFTGSKWKLVNKPESMKGLSVAETGGAVSIDLSSGNFFEVAYGANTAITFDNPPTSDEVINFKTLLKLPEISVYSLADAAYTGKSGRAYGSNLSALYISPDGTTLFVLVWTVDNIYQFTLSTPWDASTATFTGKYFNVSAQDTEPRAMTFKPDGTTLYITGITNDKVYQYTLSTPWDVSTASYADKSFPVGTQDSSPLGMLFKPDGTRMYITGPDTDRIYQYDLSTPWDVSTASYNFASFYVGGQDTSPTGIDIKSDGTKMYVNGYTTKNIYEYTLSTPWDVSSASYEGVSFYVGNQETQPYAVFFKPNGTYMYMCGLANGRVYQYSTSTDLLALRTYSLVDAVYTGQSGGAWGNNMTSLYISPDGTNLYTLIYSTDTIRQFSLSTPWEVSTASYVRAFVVTQDTEPRGVTFKPDGTKMYVTGITNDRVYQYELSTPWDISSALYFRVFPTSQAAMNGAWFNSDGTRMFISDNATSTVYQYDLATPWDVSTAVYNSVSFYAGNQDTNTGFAVFKSDGSKMYMVGATNDRVFEYPLSTPWNLSSASYEGVSFYVGSQEATPQQVFFKPDGRYMYICGLTNGRVYQYSTYVNLSSITWPSNIYWQGGFPPILDSNGQMLIDFTSSDGGTTYYAGTVERNIQ